MKKIIIFTLATAVVPTFCMNEQQKQRPQTSSYVKTSQDRQQKQPFFVSYSTAELSTTVPLYITANEPGWEKYDHIMNAPYTANTPTIQANANSLMPIYIARESEQITPTKKEILDGINTMLIQEATRTAQIKKEIEERDRQIIQFTAKSHELIYSINTQINHDTMKKLYDEAYNFAYYNVKDHSIKSTDLQKKELISLIKANMSAYNKGINEDIMAQFTYDQWALCAEHYYAPLIFPCLKQYRLTVTKTQEWLPNENNNIIEKKPSTIPLNSDIAKSFGINIENITSMQQSTQQTPTNPYPAYQELIKNLTDLFNTQQSSIKLLIAWLYDKNTNVLKTTSTNGEYTDLTDDFYQTAHELLVNLRYFDTKHTDAPIYNLCHLIQMIDKAKKSNTIQHANDLGLNLLNHKPNFWIRFLYNQEAISYLNNTISLISVLIEKYNVTRKDKITPTPEQYLCYKAKKNFNLALLDSFDSHILNENIYALTELGNLFDDITRLHSNSTAEHRQFLVDQLYNTGNK